MEKLKILLLILIIGGLYGCATYHFKYEPGTFITKTIDVKTRITVNVKKTEGFGSLFPELNKDIREAIIKDLQESVFPITVDTAPDLFVSVDVKFLRYKDYFFLYYPLYYIITLPPLTAGIVKIDEGQVAEGSLLSLLGCISMLSMPFARPTGLAKVSLTLYNRNHELISKCFADKSIKKWLGITYGHKYEIMKNNSVISLALSQVMNDIKLQIKRDRYKIMEAIKKAKEHKEPTKQEVTEIISEDITSPFIQPPKLIFNYLLVDENGDKILDGGEKISLKVIIKNQGEDIAQGVKVLLSGNSKALDYLGRERYLGDIQPNTQKVTIFETVLPYRIEPDDASLIIKVTEARGFDALKESELQVAMLPAKMEREIEIISTLVDVDLDITVTRMNKKNGIAVIIGNENYKKANVPPVRFASEDASIIKQYLIKTLGYREWNIIYFNDATQADFNGIFGIERDYKGRLYNLVKPNQSDVFVYYSGHGAPDPESKNGYFVPVDCDPSLVALNGYSLNTFYKNLSKIDYKSLTVVIDACFSGSSEAGMLLHDISPIFIKVENPVTTKKNSVIFNSATGEQVSSWYSEKKHSLFTYYFLKALQGKADKNKDNKLTAGEIKDYINNNVPYMARRLNNREQTPQVIGDMDKVIVKY